jgi:hypothetical protein
VEAAEEEEDDDDDDDGENKLGKVCFDAAREEMIPLATSRKSRFDAMLRNKPRL